MCHITFEQCSCSRVLVKLWQTVWSVSSIHWGSPLVLPDWADRVEPTAPITNSSGPFFLSEPERSSANTNHNQNHKPSSCHCFPPLTVSLLLCCDKKEVSRQDDDLKAAYSKPFKPIFMKAALGHRTLTESWVLSHNVNQLLLASALFPTRLRLEVMCRGCRDQSCSISSQPQQGSLKAGGTAPVTQARQEGGGDGKGRYQQGCAVVVVVASEGHLRAATILKASFVSPTRDYFSFIDKKLQNKGGLGEWLQVVVNHDLNRVSKKCMVPKVWTALFPKEIRNLIPQ